MKTGLLTFHAAHHYGAQLQAWALMEAIGNNGSDCEIIDYVRGDTLSAKRLFRPWKSPVAWLANLHTLLHLPALRRRAERFEQFVSEAMHLSPKSYRTLAELENDCPWYDAYVCGSDQIWNPFIYREQDFDPVFFAAFANGGRKIAYAPSFGILEMPLAHHAALRAFIAGFDALSVRECNGETILREVCGREAVTVLDPTLLPDADVWKGIAATPDIRTPYLLCYFLSDPAPYTAQVRAIAARLGLPIVSLCGARRTVSGTRRIILDAGPKEFIGWFAGASFVLTDSFHGTVFSVNFRRQFLTFAFTGSGKAKVSSRLESILGILGLTDRLRISSDPKEMNGGTLPEIAYDGVHEILERERARSLAWLGDALAGRHKGTMP